MQRRNELKLMSVEEQGVSQEGWAGDAAAVPDAQPAGAWVAWPRGTPPFMADPGGRGGFGV